MARTFRNRHTIAKGWTVRDDGRPYWNGTDKYGWEIGVRPPKYRRPIYRCEIAYFRREHYRKYRTRVKSLIHHGRFDEILMPRRTSGWSTW